MSVTTDPRWLALTTARRNELLEKHRGVNVEYEWWDSVYEQFIEKLTELGIQVAYRPRKTHNGRTYDEPQIFFSGFWSQGDGACFAGEVRDWDKLLTAMGEDRLIPFATEEGWSFGCTTGNRYCHSGTMGFDGEMCLPENPFDEDDQLLQHEAWAIGKPTEGDTDGLFDQLKEKFRSLADELYADLEEEHDYLTSDERVIEYILEYAEDELVEEAEEEDEIPA